MKKNILSKSILTGLLSILLITLTFTACKGGNDPGNDVPAFNGTITKLFLSGTSAKVLNSLAMDKLDSIFTYTGVLEAGDLYFQTNKALDKDIFSSANDSTIELNGITKFTIKEKGYYEIKINGKSKAIKIAHTALGKNIFMVGVPVDSWEGTTPALLTCSDAKPFTYSYSHFFFGGIYKFILQKNSFLAQLAPEVGTGNVLYFPTADASTAAGYGDKNWKLNADGDYTITVDMLNKTQKVTPIKYYPDNVDTVFIVGNKYGWNHIDSATPLIRSTTNKNQFSITDDLDAGGFRFCFQKQTFRPGIFRVSDTQIKYYANPTPEQDTAWNLPVAGNYTITIDIATNIIDIKKNN